MLKGVVRVAPAGQEATELAALPGDLAAKLRPTRYAVRLYVLEASDLQPADRSGTSDPYLLVSLGGVTQGDRSEHVKKVNSVEFCRAFEFDTYLPGQAEVEIKARDHHDIHPTALSRRR